MQLACDTYLDEQNCYDLEVMSTLGLTDADVAALKRVRGIDNAVGTYSENVMVGITGGEEKVTVQSISSGSDINSLYLIDGEMATAADECVVPQTLLEATGKQIGDMISITETLDKDEDPSIRNTELTITGVVASPLYVYRTSGNTERSTGAVADYLYVPESNITEDYFTEIYMTIRGASELDCFGDTYERLVADEEVLVKAIAGEREQARYDQLTGDANAEIDDAQKELDEQEADAQSQLDDAQAEIDEARRQIEEGRKKLADSRAQAEEKFAAAQAEIDSGEMQLISAENKFAKEEAQAKAKRAELIDTQKETKKTLKQLKQQKSETEETLASLEEQRPQLAQAVEQYRQGLDEANAQLEALKLTREQMIAAAEEAGEAADTAEIDAQIEMLTQQIAQVEAEKAVYDEQLTQLDGGITQAQDGLTQLDDGIAQAEDGLSQIKSGIRQIDDGLASGRAQIAQARAELESGRQELAQGKAEAYEQLEQAEKELNEGEDEIKDGEKELKAKQADFEKEIADAQKEIDEAREEVGDINLPTWYVMTREGNTGISSFHQDSANLKKIGFTFPMIFFIVAVLISLSSMTRMVEEQRSLIGTFKALGYSGRQIAAKYIIYAGAATIAGSIIGEYICMIALPEIVWMIYQNFYQVPVFSTPMDMLYGSIGLIACVGCIVGATSAACWNAVHQTPASLMRPKAPTPGKRVLIEYITPVWKRLNFSHKVTMRNLFRYKKRFFMTICGIAGCATLITTGFGLRDSIQALIPLQFGGIMHYDMLAITSTDTKQKDYDELYDEICSDSRIKDALSMHEESVKLVTDSNSSQEMELFVPSDAESFTQYISLIDKSSDDDISLSDDGILLTEQAAELLNVSAGDTISMRRDDGSKADVTISAIVHNYMSHYAFITANGYEKYYGEAAKNNAFILHTASLSDAESDVLLRELNSDSRFSAVSDTEAARSAVDDRFGMLDQVVWILISAAAALAIVVLYNLSTINISERIRELATIKVLGFYDWDVYLYNTRENVLLTALGTLLGLFGGRCLTAFLLKTMEMRGIVFAPTVALKSYLIASAITVAFSFVVNGSTYFTLKKINMVEALKSVE